MKSKGNDYKEWITYAQSNLSIAKAGKKISKSVSMEDLCFNAQQAAEKPLKSYLIFLEKKYPKTHNIKELLDLLEKEKIVIPTLIKKTKSLTSYVATRYPGDYDPISVKEYKEVVKNTNTKDKLF